MSSRDEMTHCLDLQEALRLKLKGRVVVMGMGNPLRGDDGIGAEIARRLQGCTSLSVFCCQATPENYLGQVVKACPDTLLIIDAGNLQASIGAIRLLAVDELPETGFSTHTMSAASLLKFLRGRLPDLECLLLLVQPASCELGGALSPEVAKAADRIASVLGEWDKATS